MKQAVKTTAEKSTITGCDFISTSQLSRALMESFEIEKTENYRFLRKEVQMQELCCSVSL
jgi:hypothetical protein